MSLTAAAAAFALFTAIFGVVSFRGSDRIRFAAVDLVLSALMAGAFKILAVIPLSLPEPTALALFIACKTTVLLAFMAVSHQPAWTPARAAVLAFTVYVSAMPFQAQAPLDGDEPYYLLAAESIVEDFDLDLANQYRNIASSPVNRPDLVPHADDPVGSRGERYSRHEPLMAVLLAPGFAVGGVTGALLTMAFFGALLARSFMRLLEEEGISRPVSALLFGIVLLAPPVLNYATRIWPEVPAALFFIEAVRGLRQRRHGRFGAAVLALVLLKLRFVPVGAVLLLLAVLRSRRRGMMVAVTLAVLAVPFAALWFAKGNPLGVHAMWELLPREPWRFARGAFGLVLDGAAGVAFQSPFLLIGILALSRWSSVPSSARIALTAALPYLALLAMRDEWHGGWSPPLRYIVFLVPFLAVAAAPVIQQVRAGLWPVVLSLCTLFLAVHSLAYPWRLFAIAGGENFAGEWLSIVHRADFSRLFPSFIRPNLAAGVAAGVFLVVLAASRWLLPRMIASRSELLAAAIAVVIAMAAWQGNSPGAIVHLEDAHVERAGGSLDPHEWTIARFRFRGGWRLAQGESVRFQYRGGPARVRYHSAEPVEIELSGLRTTLPPTGGEWAEARVETAAGGRLSLAVLSGEATFDSIERIR